MHKFIFLTGMMASGKTTMGKELARQIGAKFVDLDAVIEAREGKTIPEIFEAQGEAGFRAAETAALGAVCAQHPCVVATGGGCILREENVTQMRKSGIIVLLDRPLEHMLRDVNPQSRPNLAGDAHERMKALYAQRRERYHATCDIAFDNSGSPFAAVKRLLRDTRISAVRKN